MVPREENGCVVRLQRAIPLLESRLRPAGRMGLSERRLKPLHPKALQHQRDPVAGWFRS